MSTPLKSALITGCSDGGIGSALVAELHSRGYRVFATARNVAKMADVASLPNVETLRLDVTEQESVEEAAKEVERVTAGKLHILINNAGATAVVPALDAPFKESQEMFDINFWGPFRVTQAFAPMLISTKGLVVNVCSINAYLNPPFQAVYTASKAAQESWSETLRIEMKPLGVKVQTVITGVVKTNVMSNSPVPKLREDSHYKSEESKIVGRAQGADLGNVPQPVAKFAKAVVGDIEAGVSGRTHRGALGTTSVALSSYLPTWVKDYVLVRDSGLDSMASSKR